MIKRIIAPIVAIVLALSTLGVALAATAKGENNEGCSATTIKDGQKVSLAAGRDGVSISSSIWAGELEVCRNSALRPRFTKDMNLVFKTAALHWDVEKTEKVSDAFNHGTAFVNFELTTALQKDWKAGTLAIYHWDGPSKTWLKLATKADSSTEISARATGFGYYVLGVETAAK